MELAFISKSLVLSQTNVSAIIIFTPLHWQYVKLYWGLCIKNIIVNPVLHDGYIYEKSIPVDVLTVSVVEVLVDVVVDKVVVILFDAVLSKLVDDSVDKVLVKVSEYSEFRLVELCEFNKVEMIVDGLNVTVVFVFLFLFGKNSRQYLKAK